VSLCLVLLCRVSRFIYCQSEYDCAECRNAECRYTECRYAECRYAECRVALISTTGANGIYLPLV
jgi:hypothetical protein